MNPLRLKATSHSIRLWCVRHQMSIGYFLVVGNWWSILPAFAAGWQGDTSIYRKDAAATFAGQIPYRDFVVEYPPYALLVFSLPQLFGTANYLDGFKILTSCCEILIRSELFWIGMHSQGTCRRWLPLYLYIFGVPFLRSFLLQRFDLWPAAICITAIFAFSAGRFVSSGLLIAIGAGLKVYPALFILPLGVVVVRNQKGRQFLLGLSLGLAPLIILLFIMPWWRFATFQGSRGLQVESLWASLIWGAHQLGMVDADWLYVDRWFEIRGAAAAAMLPFARATFLTALTVSTVLACVGAWRVPAQCCARLSRLCLLPLLAFVGFNQVLSPQFMIWLLPLAALSSFEGGLCSPLAVVFAVILTPIIFPSFGGDYGRGLSGWETGVLIFRNMLLLFAWMLLLLEHTRLQAPQSSERYGDTAL